MTKRILVVLAVLATVLASATASAHGRGRVHFGVHLGAPLFWGYPYYAPPPTYVFQPAPVYYPASPPVFVERDAPAQEAPPQSWWYHCEQTRSYYPYVKTCPGGWQRVPPTPSSQGSPQ
jgi:hypothetical protein